jgi:hypothetical protein
VEAKKGLDDAAQQVYDMMKKNGYYG